MGRKKKSLKRRLGVYGVVFTFGLGLGLTIRNSDIEGAVDSASATISGAVADIPRQIDSGGRTPEEEGIPESLPPTSYVEIHSKHFFYGIPTGTEVSNDLVIRDIYALSSNDRTKIADWVAYRLDPSTMEGGGETERKWAPDPWLSDEETLEPEDYNGANRELSTDRGHQAPLASFKGTDDWHQTNYLSNITPQRSALNQGPWRILEENVRSLVRETGDEVYVVTGPLFEEEFGDLPGADEKHEVPSAYWKIACHDKGGGWGGINCAAYIFDQDTARNASLLDHLVTIDEVEKRSGLDFMRSIPNKEEKKIERTINRLWAEDHLN